jgi:hypothetical protein
VLCSVFSLTGGHGTGDGAGDGQALCVYAIQGTLSCGARSRARAGPGMVGVRMGDGRAAAFGPFVAVFYFAGTLSLTVQYRTHRAVHTVNSPSGWLSRMGEFVRYASSSVRPLDYKQAQIDRKTTLFVPLKTCPYRDPRRALCMVHGFCSFH